MTAQEHALDRLRIAKRMGRWEFVDDAIGILDGATNSQPKPEPFRLPEQIRHMQRARAV